MFSEPTSDGLKAQAGWALFKRAETTPEHAVALDKYRDGCEALIPYSESGTAQASVGDVKLPAAKATPSRPEIVPDGRADSERIRAIVESYSTNRLPTRSLQVESGGCAHRFNAADPDCLYCGVSKREALAQRGRKPEFVT